MTFRDACEEARRRADSENRVIQVVFRPELFGPLSKDGYEAVSEDDGSHVAPDVRDWWRTDKTMYPRKGLAKQSTDQVKREDRLAAIKAEKLHAQASHRGFHWCEQCGYSFTLHEGPKSLDLDHIKPRGEGGDDSPENLQLLCRGVLGGQCHAKKHSGQRTVGAEAR